MGCHLMFPLGHLAWCVVADWYVYRSANNNTAFNHPQRDCYVIPHTDPNAFPPACWNLDFFHDNLMTLRYVGSVCVCVCVCVCVYVCVCVCVVCMCALSRTAKARIKLAASFHTLVRFLLCCFAWLRLQRSLVDRYWGQTIEAWFAHTPHLFERAAMLDIETKMHAEVQVTRRNRYRNARTDINIHLQVQHLPLIMSLLSHACPCACCGCAVMHTVSTRFVEPVDIPLSHIFCCSKRRVAVCSVPTLPYTIACTRNAWCRPRHIAACSTPSGRCVCMDGAEATVDP